MPTSTPCHAVHLYAAPAQAMLIQALVADNANALRLPGRRAQNARLTIYCDSAVAGAGIAGRLRDIVRQCALPNARVRQSGVPAEAWRDNWKKFFRRRRVSARLLLTPPWLRDPAPRGVHLIEIDPGLSFGTGLHATTRACLRLADQYTAYRAGGPPPAALDLGCGSGILAIAAARLGYRPVLALDNDPQAIRAARRNRDANGLQRRIACRKADVLRLVTGRKYHLITANLLAGLLIDAAPRIAAAAADGAHVILAGILRRQYPAVRRAYRSLGFRQISVIDEGEWRTGGFIYDG